MRGTARYPEIDLLRGIAIMMMIIFHSLFDLSFFR
ncbi:MAG: heparan-alpha-glucosaminide N-acetyltransferase domain-containing protein, partial [Methanoregula sp.]